MQTTVCYDAKFVDDLYTRSEISLFTALRKFEKRSTELIISLKKLLYKTLNRTVTASGQSRRLRGDMTEVLSQRVKQEDEYDSIHVYRQI